MNMHDSTENLDYRQEVLKSCSSPLYFLETYVMIYDATDRVWLPFRLWPAQATTLKTIQVNRLVCILKARQLGLTWLVMAFALWLMLFRPAATVLLFSRRDDEATDLLKTRLGGMYDRLPSWLKVRSFEVDNEHEWRLSNGSRALAFPTTAGDSYSATLAVVDEADLVPDLEKMLNSVKPTIDSGGRMVLLSRVNKSAPGSLFKRIYASAKQKTTDWVHVFLPWDVRPGRDQAWYDSQKTEILQHTGSLDALHEQYPAADTEALAPRSLDKRIPAEWLQQCFQETQPIQHEMVPAIPGLVVFALPIPGRTYVVGLDPAEGNPTSDDSALEVLDKETGKEVAALAGKLQPSVLAAYADTIGHWYNDAGILVERNNHGHAVLLWLENNSSLWRIPGEDNHPGWLTTSRSKALLYNATADAFRTRQTILHSFATFTQLSSVDGNTLRAPDGEHDDRAVAFALASIARQRQPVSTVYPYDLICSPTPEDDPNTWKCGDIEIHFDDDDDGWDHPLLRGNR
jgi:hypothetical protein